ncbi:MAG: UDP-N-acetylmuramoyl-tripeptide--D-alanyl-D-alanine ligase [Rhodothermales bacterium]|jgi:UDP-N-acetylmuramoyl-tripeptide--D-alanyl-D-alanine ligase
MAFSQRELALFTTGRWLRAPSDALQVCEVSTDSRSIGPGHAFLALRGERFDGHDFISTALERGASVIIAETPPIADSTTAWLLVEDCLRAYQDLAAFHRMRWPSLPLIGITGSSGKTSSKEIIACILRAKFANVLATAANTNNLIGVPQNLLRLSDHDAAVIELGTNAPGEIATLAHIAFPSIAVITSIGPVHLEGLGDVEGVAREKASICEGLPANGLAIVPEGWKAAVSAAHVLTIGGDYQVTDYVARGLEGASFSVVRNGKSLHINWLVPGEHQASNAAAAVAVADQLGIPDATIAAALAEFALPGMRMAQQEIAGVNWINDAYNANPDSIRALIDCLLGQDNLILVLGDMLELGPNEASHHVAVLRYAQEKLPDARILPVGPRMAAAAASLDIPASPDLDAARALLTPHPGDSVALKASRGMALERLIPGS